MISFFLTNYSLNKVLEIHYIAQCHKTFYLKLKYPFSLTSFPLPWEYDAERLNAFKASEAPTSLTFQGLSYIEIWASGSPFHFQLADKIFHDNEDRCRLPLRRSSIKASVMRSDESWEFSNATKRCFLRQGYGETLEWATGNFPALISGDIGWIFPLILHLTSRCGKKMATLRASAEHLPPAWPVVSGFSPQRSQDSYKKSARFISCSSLHSLPLSSDGTERNNEGLN